MKYISLAPRNEKRKEYEEYYNALDFAIKDKSIKNIAITGSYSAGKSSVIESYLNSRKNLKAIRVSLAKLGKLSEKELEEEVLKCLFYSIDGGRIDGSLYSQVRCKVNFKDVAAIMISMCFIIILFTFLSLFIRFISYIKENPQKSLNDTIYIFNKIKVYFFTSKKWVILTAMLMLFILSYFSIKKIIKSFARMTKYIKNINIDKVKAEFSDNNSIIDKNIHEIINMIINIDENILIFEDLDRCKNIEVFVKLRNICVLLNNNEIVKNKFNNIFYKLRCLVKKIKISILKKFNNNIDATTNDTCIKFIYCVKDDFIIPDNNSDNNWSEKRVKFFDFIVPVIPIVTKNNISDDLRNALKDCGLSIDDNKYIDDISLYIGNKRIINNVINEFNIYKGTLLKVNNEFDDRQLFTMMVYKNINPKGFKIMQEEDTLRKTFRAIDKKIVELENKFQKELDILEKKVYPYKTNNDIEKEEQLKKYLKAIENDSESIYKHQDISSIISDNGNSEFIKTAIENKYIDKNYFNYINYFYEGQLTINDKQILKKICSGNELSKNDELTNANNVFDRLSEEEYNKKSIYNLSLLRCAISDKSSNIKTIIFVNTILKNYGINSVVEFVKYVDENELKEKSNDITRKFLRVCLKCQELIFNELDNTNISDSDKFYLTNKITQLLTNDEIKNIDNDNILTKVVSINLESVSNLKNKEQDRFIENYDFSCDLIKNDYNENIGGLVKKIVEHKLEESRPVGYYNLLNHYFKYIKKNNKTERAFDESNYDYIINNSDETIIKNINDNADIYVENCLLKTKSVKLTKNIVDLLYEINSNEVVKKLIMRLKGNYNIEDFNFSLSDDEQNSETFNNRKKYIYDCVLQNHELDLKLDSLYKYYCLNGWTQYLTEYITNKIKYLLSHNHIEEDSLLNKFFCSLIVECKNIDNIIKLLNGWKITMSNSEFLSMPEGLKRELLLNNNLMYNKTLIQIIKNIDEELLIIYLRDNINEFLKNCADYSLTSNELEKLLLMIIKSNSISDEQIANLVDKQIFNKPIEPNSETEKIIVTSNFNFNNYIIQNIVPKFTKEKIIKYILSKVDKLDNSKLSIILSASTDIFFEYKIGEIDKGYLIKKSDESLDGIADLITILSKKSLVKILNDDDKEIVFQRLY